MARFADAAGREWPLNITFGMAGELKSDANFDLGAPNNETFGRVLYSDPFGLVKVLWVIIRRDAEKLGVTNDQFLEAMDGETLDLACDALMEALSDFIHRRRSATVKARLPELMAAVDKAHEKVTNAAADLILKNLAGESLAASESIHAT